MAKNKPEKIHMPRNILRRHEIWKEHEKEDATQNGKKLTWEVGKPDQRTEITVPIELLRNQEIWKGTQIRRVAAGLFTMLFQKKPKNGELCTSFREICQYSGMAYHPDNIRAIKNAIYQMMFTMIVLHNYPIRIESRISYGEIHTVLVASVKYENKDVQGNTIPVKNRKLVITFPEEIQKIIDEKMMCYIPIEKLQKCGKLPPKQRKPAENLVFFLASSREGKIHMKTSSIAEIMGISYEERHASRVHNKILSIIKEMENLQILEGDYDSAKDLWSVILMKKAGETQIQLPLPT